MFGLLECVVLFVSTLVVLCVKKLTTGHPQPVFNIYRRPGNFYWTKIVLVYLAIAIRRMTAPKLNWEEQERPRKLTNGDQDTDVLSFRGSDRDGNHLILNLTRRGNNTSEVFVFVKHVGAGTFQLVQRLPVKAEDFEGGGLRIGRSEDGEWWKVRFEGKLRTGDGNDRDFVLEGSWRSDLPKFHSDFDANAWLIAKAAANEAWNWDYFQILHLLYYTHYEQPGQLEATLKVDSEEHNLLLDTTREHYYSDHMDRRHLHRYGLHTIALENGDRIKVGMISMPVTFSSLHVGYIYSVRTGKICAIEDCDLRLYQHGERGSPPRDYAFSFVAANKKYVVEVQVSESPEFNFGEHEEARVLESLCKFRVNGRRGWGTVEWLYRNVGGGGVVSDRQKTLLYSV